MKINPRKGLTYRHEVCILEGMFDAISNQENICQCGSCPACQGACLLGPSVMMLELKGDGNDEAGNARTPEVLEVCGLCQKANIQAGTGAGIELTDEHSADWERDWERGQALIEEQTERAFLDADHEWRLEVGYGRI